MSASRDPTSRASDDLALGDTVAIGDLEAVLAELAHAPPRQLELRPDDRVGRFTVLRTIGRGGSGIVHEARDLELGRHVALKVMRTRGEPGSSSQGAIESLFKREADAAARLNHPNIVTLHDFGTISEGCPYLVLELLRGESLEARIARGPLTVEDALAVMIELCQGLCYAHRMGVVHRDLKPANVFQTEEGPVKVLDFGLARLRAAVGPAGSLLTLESVPAGTNWRIAGTPAYMAPEQWRGEIADERTDVYAAGLILYEMLTGERPWPAADPRVSALAAQPVPPVTGVPAALTQLLARALDKDRAARLATAKELLDGLTAIRRALEGRHAARRAWRIRRAFIAAVPLLVAGSWASIVLSQRVARRREVDVLLARADELIARARAAEPEVDTLRRRALEHFDASQLDAAGPVWAEALARGAAVDRTWALAGQTLERAFVHDGSRGDVRRRLGAVLLARARIADRDHDRNNREELAERLATFGDRAALASWNAPAQLTVETSPPGAEVSFERYQAGAPAVLVPERAVATTPFADVVLPAGSYLLRLRVAGRPEVRWPVLLAGGERHHAAIRILAHVPDGFIYVPAGRFQYGYAGEELRGNFGAQPEHAVTTEAYFIARHEVTFGEWIVYLEALPPAEQANRLPRVVADAPGAAGPPSGGDDLALRRERDGRWQLTFRGHSARDDEPWVYADRRVRSAQAWARFPVAGISFDDAEAYAAWLARTGRVPGARLCDEHEWERAARGADARSFPHGDGLVGDDANIDVAYGQKERAFGLDEVGSHPASDSPFGVADLAGNVWEWTRAVAGSERGQWERGGCWYQDAITARTYNRAYLPRTFANAKLGLRVCASVPADG